MHRTTANIPFQFRELTSRILGCAIEVHRALGPGLVESAYCACLDRELTLQGVPFLREVPVTIEYKDLTVPNAYRADFVVAGSIVIEVKSVDSLISVHQAQLLTYLKLMNLDVGLLLNFNEVTLKKGIRRMARTRLPGTKFPGFS